MVFVVQSTGTKFLNFFNSFLLYYLLRPNLPDENDNIFFECAFANNSDYIVNSNIKDFRQRYPQEKCLIGIK